MQVHSLTFDSEDLGALGGDALDAAIAKLKDSGAMCKDLQVGFAGSYSLFSQEPSKMTNVNELFPELYWWANHVLGRDELVLVGMES